MTPAQINLLLDEATAREAGSMAALGTVVHAKKPAEVVKQLTRLARQETNVVNAGSWEDSMIKFAKALGDEKAAKKMLWRKVARQVDEREAQRGG